MIDHFNCYYREMMKSYNKRSRKLKKLSTLHWARRRWR